MQKILLLLLLPILSNIATAQEDYKFGKITRHELEMSSYDKAPDAEAVILYQDTYIWYDMNLYKLICDYKFRIKILKPEGASYADVTIPYMESGNAKEGVSGLDAAAYNLTDGDIVKTPLKKQYVSTQEVSKGRYVMKFSIPDVKAGTVIEYKYRKTSDYVGYIPNLEFQHSIPVVYSISTARIPEFYRFHIMSKGFLPIDIKETESTGTILANQSNGRLDYKIRDILCEMRDVPALKEEPFIWDLDDFRSMLKFELSSVAMPYQMVEQYTNKWSDVNKTLSEMDFGTHLRISNPYKKETEAIVAQYSDQTERLRAILQLVRSKITWNKSYRLFSNGPRAAADKGEGSSADINFILNAAIKGAGFKTTPILLNPRQYGRLSRTHASIDDINTFIIRVTLADEKYAYLDGADPYSDIDVLSTSLLVDRARIYGADDQDGWVDLTTLTQSKTLVSMIFKMDENGVLTGKLYSNFTNQAAREVNIKYKNARSKEEYIEQLEKEDNIKIDSLEVNGLGTTNVSRESTIQIKGNNTENYIYLNVTGMSFMSKNMLNSQTRLLPVEFPNAETYNLRCVIELPEGYTVEEIPKNIMLTTCEDGVQCKYIAQIKYPYILTNLTFTMNRIIYPTIEYADLSAFFGKVAELSNSMIVIKKKTN